MGPPPLTLLTPEPVRRGELLWTWDGYVTRAVLGRFPVRMVVAGYALPDGGGDGGGEGDGKGGGEGDDGKGEKRITNKKQEEWTAAAEKTAPTSTRRRVGLVVVSPFAPTPPVVAWLHAAGDLVTFIVAPNKHHTWWAGAMKRAFPAALLVAPDGVARAAAGTAALPVDVRVTPLAGADDLPGAWPRAALDVLPIKGLGVLDELALLHRPSRTLILQDTAFNFGGDDWLRGALGGAAPGLLLRTYLNAVDGRRRCCFTGTFARLIDDPEALRGSFDEMLTRWDFDQVSVAHGAFIAAPGGKDALAAGSVAFVDAICRRRDAAARGEREGGGGLAGAGAAMLTAAAVITTAVGIGVAGILQARSGGGGGGGGGGAGG